MHESYKKQLIEAGLKMINSNYVSGTAGNISIRIEGENLFAITPSGMPYDRVTEEDIPILDFEGKMVDGKRKPSIEYQMHGDILREIPEIKAVVHTHAVHATALSIIREPIPAVTEGTVLIGGSVPVAEYGNSGSEKLAENVLAAMRNSRAVLMANHGLICGAENLDKAFSLCESVERTAMIYLLALSSGKPVHVIPPEDAEECIRFIRENYGQK
jgi:L-fuculose-phosphate aldolase